jgi:hypothetical protein
MWRTGVLAIVAAITVGSPPTNTKDLTFLTRNGCVNTSMMRKNLDDALRTLGWKSEYQVIDIGTLTSTDVRTGYPTPTLLWKGRDIFGMPAPRPPYSAPS